ncbi:SpaA isopeptide-forming pilin-related protein [uncultured Faecalibaculum sp.]|uniref:SpaA isopeptide-forming pilin-related protein n=1 Tax=uncultured Faecalibaculum sp. TaxID=1729681 RepID=UPI0025DDDB73|nr:SpaA isopeptide-forming pilin-related protein [uncultured Faecalibaculum sp.]
MRKLRRNVYAAALGTAMLLGQAAPVLAEEPGAPAEVAADKGSVTVTAATQGMNYSIYQLFKGDFKEGSVEIPGSLVDGTAQTGSVPGMNKLGNVEFGSAAGENGATLIGAINSYMNDDDFVASNASAYDVALKIAETPALQTTKFSNYLAKALEKAVCTTKTADGETVVFNDLDSGYYLITSTEPQDAADTEKTHTSAIMLPVDGDVTIHSKTSKPTLEKEIKEGDKKDWNSAGTVGVIKKDDTGDFEITPVKFRLTGTVAKDIADYETYSYKFVDTLPAGIDLNGTFPSDWITTIQISGKSAAGEPVGPLTLQGANMPTPVVSKNSEELSTVTWSWSDLKTVLDACRIDYSYEHASDIVITVEYEVHLTDAQIQELYKAQAEISDPFTNTAYVEFSNNPRKEDSKDKTPDDEVNYYSFNLELHKTDDSKNALSGAEFQLTDELGNIVGNLITTDQNGNFVFTGLDSDKVYTLTEIKAPDGYKKIEPITFKLVPNYTQEENKKLDSVDIVIVSDPSKALTVTGDKTETNNTFHITTVDVEGTVVNIEGPSMPLTGQAGIWTGVAAGGIVIALSAYGILRKKKESE